jgi:hypothetical protein
MEILKAGADEAGVKSFSVIGRRKRKDRPHLTLFPSPRRKFLQALRAA